MLLICQNTTMRVYGAWIRIEYITLCVHFWRSVLASGSTRIYVTRLSNYVLICVAPCNLQFRSLSNLSRCRCQIDKKSNHVGISGGLFVNYHIKYHCKHFIKRNVSVT